MFSVSCSTCVNSAGWLPCTALNALLVQTALLVQLRETLFFGGVNYCFCLEAVSSLLLCLFAQYYACALTHNIKTFSVATGLRSCLREPRHIATNVITQGNAGCDVSVKFEIAPI